MSDRVAVMYLGEIVELADTAELFEQPRHPYTQALLRAIPVPSPHRRAMTASLTGDVPSPLAPPPGEFGRTPCDDTVCTYLVSAGGADPLKNKKRQRSEHNYTQC